MGIMEPWDMSCVVSTLIRDGAEGSVHVTTFHRGAMPHCFDIWKLVPCRSNWKALSVLVHAILSTYEFTTMVTTALLDIAQSRLAFDCVCVYTCVYNTF